MALKVELIAHGNEETCAKAALTCTSAESVHEIFAANKSHLKTLERVYEMGHTSIIEHQWFTFLISGISRAASHQLVRTRMASYSQKSQRYVQEKQFEYVIPPVIASYPEERRLFEEGMRAIQAAYSRFVERGIPAEDARFILPNACETQIVMTMNARSLLHFLAERLCTTAQWEIRFMARAMFNCAKEASPTILQYAGPKCEAAGELGVCREGLSRWEKCQRKPHISQVTLIKKQELSLLESDSAKLNALECAGVDNWDGYDWAMQSMKEDG